MGFPDGLSFWPSAVTVTATLCHWHRSQKLALSIFVRAGRPRCRHTTRPGAGPVHLPGHSRGGHLAFRVAQRRPDLLRKLILAEPGGDLDASLAFTDTPVPSRPPLRAHVAAAAEKVASGDIDGGLACFWDAIEGQGAWLRLSDAAKQGLRDNALTLLGQINEARQPYSRADAESICVPTLFIGVQDTPGSLPRVLRALAAHVPGAQVAMMPHATHMMFEDDPVRFSGAVLDFLHAP